jgi:hypothetical protein
VANCFVFVTSDAPLSVGKIKVPPERGFFRGLLVYNSKTSRYEWHFVMDDGIEPEMKTEGTVTVVDLGEIHPAISALRVVLSAE